ncbi:MAG: putative LPS assembly protein LptD [Gemmatimonadota bacterium]|nr:putative LPS assembly protein LptD [Gemmatimonadota bacterium]
MIGGAGSAATARANPAPILRLALVSDTDSVVAARDTIEVDSTGVRRDSLGRILDSLGVARDTIDQDLTTAAGDTTDVEGEFPEPDAIFDELAARSGYRVIQYQGREVSVDIAEEAVQLDGDARAEYGGSVLDAQHIAYWIGLQFINASESATLSGEGQTVTTQSVINYDVSRTKGSIMDARTSFAERGTEWFVRGDATLRGGSTFFVETGDFTSCELDEPHYYFKAGSIKVVTENVIVAWPVTLYINEVPVIWLPFFAQDIRPGRRSGFLPPRFGINDIVATSSTVNRSVTDFGYYFAINEFMDAQATIDWFSGDFTRLNAGFRYKDIKKFFQGSLSGSYSLGDSKIFQLRAQHQHDVTPVTNIRLNANFVTNTRAFEDQSLDPRLQTQRISSDLGVQHRFPFASVNLSASSRQDLGTLQGTTDLTLPRIQATFTPVTLFRAPRNRAGAFNNIVVSGGASYSRVSRLKEEADDLLSTRANATTSFRLGSLGFSGQGNFDNQLTTPFDSIGTGVESSGRTRIDYGGSADYQLDLIGSTTLRPTVSIDASRFSSVDTDDRYIAAPTRIRMGATLSTDIFGFLPGFGPFERIRHKVSPRFSYSYSPAVEVPDSLLSIPGFPISSSAPQNRLGISLNQTFEAKLREDIELDAEEQALLEGRDIVADSIQSRADSLARTAADSAAAAAPPDSAGVVSDSVTVRDSLAVRSTPARPTPPPRQRNVVLLGINSSSLDFDFSKKGEPALVTDQWSHRINSDLLRGLSLNLTLDMFDGRGTERTLAPILSAVTGGFTFSSARGLGGLFGLGGGQGQRRDDPDRRLTSANDRRYRMQSFDENPDPLDPGLRSGGPWTLGLTYSLQRFREDESAQGRQSLGATLALNPTPNWRLSWRTNYNLTDKTFGEHLVALDRDLHRWIASFIFSRAPNGNFIFSMSVSLRDAPDLKFDYDQRTFDR